MPTHRHSWRCILLGGLSMSLNAFRCRTVPTSAGAEARAIFHAAIRIRFRTVGSIMPKGDTLLNHPDSVDGTSATVFIVAEISEG